MGVGTSAQVNFLLIFRSRINPIQENSIDAYTCTYIATKNERGLQASLLIMPTT